jgi:hypothetical protein
MNQNISKPPYWLGLLGLIPLIGFFVGIGLLLYGIIKYKSKKLIIIGIACMIYTIIVYLTIFYVGFKSKVFSEMWKEHAQMQLNTLVKHIEYYKLENGTYPDSLQQLESKDEFIFLTDPTQSMGTYYNYKNLGDKYLLFSSGTDRIPNTEDDIFPEVSPNNKNIGWIKEP